MYLTWLGWEAPLSGCPGKYLGDVTLRIPWLIRACLVVMPLYPYNQLLICLLVWQILIIYPSYILLCQLYWLVVRNVNFIFPFSWEFHHPNWWTHIFQRGRYTTNQIWVCFETRVTPQKALVWHDLFFQEIRSSFSIMFLAASCFFF